MSELMAELIQELVEELGATDDDDGAAEVVDEVASEHDAPCSTENWVESVSLLVSMFQGAAHCVHGMVGARLMRRERGYDLHWNSPVPSTMINMPYPESVCWVPAGKEHGTFHEYEPSAAETPSTMALDWRTQLDPGPLHRTRETV